MKKIVFVVYLLWSLSAGALVPVEGILMGEANQDIQHDPLQLIFSDYYDKTRDSENARLKLYLNFYQSGVGLKESCSYLQEAKYYTPWEKKQATRSIVSTLQYLGLDTTIKAMGAYAKKMDLAEKDFQQLSSNLVKNYCSRNVTIFSVKSIEAALTYYYQNPQMQLIPSVEGSPFVTADYVSKTESIASRSREFDQLIRNFKSFCSWGGDVTDYRMLAPYLKNEFIMSYVFKHLIGIKDHYFADKAYVGGQPNTDAVQVLCEDLICRKVPQSEFSQKWPKTVGSSGLFMDASKLWCFDFRLQDYSSKTLPQVKNWIKEQEIEDPIFQTNFFISLVTGIPDAVFSVSDYNELATLAKSSLDERWNSWAKSTLGTFSRDMLFEESLIIKPVAVRDAFKLKQHGLSVDFSITLGEMDRIMKDRDKLETSFQLRLSKNYLRMTRSKWKRLNDDLDTEGLAKFKTELVRNLNIQLKEKESLFKQKMWNENFADLIAEELLAQLNLYSSPVFDSYRDEMISIPVRFSYGLFALSYLRYRADVNAGRLKLNL